MRDKRFCLSKPVGHLIGLEDDQIGVVSLLATIEEQVEMLAQLFGDRASSDSLTM